MTNATHNHTVRTTDSTDRCPALASRTTRPANQPKASRFGPRTRRFFDALMRSLAAPHI
jgi:hypothetical protein